MIQLRSPGPPSRHVRLAAGLVALLAAAPAAAQTVAPGFSAGRLEPAAPGSDWFSLDSLDLRGKARPSLGLTLDWARKPLVLYGPDGNEQAAIVRDQPFLHLGGALVVADRARLSLLIPLAVGQGGTTGVLDGVEYRAPDGAALGDVRVGGNVRLMGAAGEPFTLALAARVWLPTGSREDYTGDGRVRFAPRLAFAGEIDALAYAGRVGFDLRRRVEQGAAAVGPGLDAAFAVGWRGLDGALLLGPELVAGSSFRDFFGAEASPVELLFGAHLRAGESWRVGAGVGPGLSQGPGAPSLRIVAQVAWFPALPPPDRDQDGIIDAEDACPDTVGFRTGDPATNGCPPPPDSDQDGIPDPEDACPQQPGGRSTDPRTSGCPPPPPPDTDGDGVIDAQDACPDVVGVATGDPRTNGCPPDRDGDGIADPEDACPDVAGVPSPDPARRGCPPDRDGDGVLDARDACPDHPGSEDLDPQKSGCPIARVEGRQIRTLEPVRFPARGARVAPESDPILDAVARILTASPELSVRVEGHADDPGSPAVNRRLSQNRAKAVVDALVKRGIDRKRLRAVGYGKERPIDDGRTEAGRANNRRVEFHID